MISMTFASRFVLSNTMKIVDFIGVVFRFVGILHSVGLRQWLAFARLINPVSQTTNIICSGFVVFKVGSVRISQSKSPLGLKQKSAPLGAIPSCFTLNSTSNEISLFGWKVA